MPDPRNLAFADALEQLYLEGNPKVPESEWRLTVNLARSAGPLVQMVEGVAIDEGLDRELVTTIKTLIYG